MDKATKVQINVVKLLINHQKSDQIHPYSQCSNWEGGGGCAGGRSSPTFFFFFWRTPTIFFYLDEGTV